MRCLLIGLGVLVAAALAMISPYRSEAVIGEIANNRTGCVINVQNSSGWKDQGIPSAWRPARLAEPVDAGVAAYECGGIIGNRPAAMILTTPGSDERREGCASSSSKDWCYARLHVPPAASGAPHRYRLLVQVRPDEPVHAIDIKVTRRIEWRSATLDGIMSV